MNLPPSPLVNARFRAFLLARVSLTLAQYALLLIVGWQTYNLARDSGMNVAEASGQLALIGLLQFLPLFMLTPLSGLAADRLDRRMVAWCSVLLQLLCGAVLAVLTWRGALGLPMLFGVAVVLGIARGFSGPALSAMAPNLVSPAQLPRAIAMSSVGWQVGMITGPALGGLLYEVLPALPYAMASALHVLAIAALWAVGPVPPGKARSTAHPVSQIREGLVYVWHNKMVLGSITLDLFAVFLAGATALFPVYARDILDVGASGLSQLAMAPAIGAGVTAAWFSFRPLKRNVGPLMLWAVAAFGVATVVFAVSTNMALSLAMLFVVGVADMFSVFIRQSFIQLHTPDDKRGRVSAVSQLTISASNEFGDFFSGSLAFLIGPVAAVALGGVGAIATVAIWAVLFPVLRTTRTFDPPEHVLEEADDPLAGPARQGS